VTQQDSRFAVHVECRECEQRLELVAPPKDHDRHLHFRCGCMPADGMLCVIMKANLAPTVKG